MPRTTPLAILTTTLTRPVLLTKHSDYADLPATITALDARSRRAVGITRRSA